MTTEEKDLITKLETRVHQLVLQYVDLQGKCHDLENQINDGLQREENLKQTNIDLQRQYDNLKVAKLLELTDTDTKNARNRLAKLVRDVDKCIAMLKASN